MILTEKKSLDAIAQTICERYNITLYELCKETRKKNNKVARFLFIYLSRIKTTCTLEQIADFITLNGRRENQYHHASVYNAFKKASNWIDTYKSDKREIQIIKQILNDEPTLVVSNVNLLLSCTSE